MSKDAKRSRDWPTLIGILLVVIGVALMLGFGLGGSEGGVAFGFVFFMLGMTFLGLSF